MLLFNIHQLLLSRSNIVSGYQHYIMSGSTGGKKRKIEASDDVFEYTGSGQTVPKNITHVRFHPSVVKVDNNAFDSCRELRKVVLNEGLQKIGNSAFYACKSVESITLPSTVTEISQSAFNRCTSLREVALNKGLRKIGPAVFWDCASLQSIAIPSTVSEIGRSAFESCNSLRTVVFSDSNKMKKTALTAYLIQNGLKKIEPNTFSDCKSLESITLPSTLTEIGERAFDRCKKLTEVELKEGLQKINQRAFYENKALKRIVIPCTVNSIGSMAFKGCTELKEVTLNHKKIKTMGDKVFEGCPSSSTVITPTK